MDIVLHHQNNSVCSEKVRMTLNEKGLDWESRELDFARGDQFKPDYLRLNPKAVVPTLVVDGVPLAESTLIVEFLDDAVQEQELKPRDPLGRHAVRMFAKMCDEGLHQGVAAISFAAVFLDRIRAQPGGAERAIERIIDLDRRDRQSALFAHGVEAPHVLRGIVAFEKAFQKIDATLADGREWLWPDCFSIAEINLVPYVARLDYLGLLDIWTHDRPAVTAWFERIKARRSFEEEVVRWIRPDECQAMLDGGTRIGPRIYALCADYIARDSGAGYY